MGNPVETYLDDDVVHGLWVIEIQATPLCSWPSVTGMDSLKDHCTPRKVVKLNALPSAIIFSATRNNKIKCGSLHFLARTWWFSQPSLFISFSRLPGVRLSTIAFAAWVHPPVSNESEGGPMMFENGSLGKTKLKIFHSTQVPSTAPRDCPTEKEVMVVVAESGGLGH